MDISHPATSPTPQALSPTPPHTPSSTSVFAFPKLHHGTGQNNEIWSSPAFLKRSRLSANHLNLQYDPFQEESDFEDNKRKRTKFGRESGQWRFAERTPSPEKEIHTISPPTTEPTAVAIEEVVEVSAALSPESLSSIQDRSNEAAYVEQDQDVSSGRPSEEANEANPVFGGGENAAGEVQQPTPEAQTEPAPLLRTSGVGKLIAKPTDALESRSLVEESTEDQEPLQSTAEGLDEDEEMGLDLPANQRPLSAPKSLAISEASIIDMNGSHSVEEVDAAASAILSQTPESSESAETSDTSSVRETSAEPTMSDEDLDDEFSELETDGGSSVSGVDWSVSSDGGLESPLVPNRTGSESEGRGFLVAETYQEAVSQMLENGHTPAVDAESPNELPFFGLDGSAFSRSRSSPSPVSPTDETPETTIIPTDSKDGAIPGNEESPPLYTQLESDRADTVKSAGVIDSEIPIGKTSLEVELAEEPKESVIEHDIAENKGAQTPNHEEVVATHWDHSERELLHARQKSPEGDDTSGVQEEPFRPGVVQGLVHDHANDVQSVPSLGSVEDDAVDLQDNDKEDIGEAEEDLSRPAAVLQKPQEAIETSANVPPRTSNVEIIDLESEGDEDDAPEDVQVQLGTEIQPTLQESNLIVTQNADDGIAFMEDKEDDTTRDLEAQADDAPLLKETHLVNAETVEPQSHVNEAKVSPTPDFVEVQSPGKAGNDDITIDAVADASSVKDETLQNTDDEFPDISDLFAASRRSITANEKAAVVVQVSQEKTSYLEFPGSKVESKIGMLVKEEMYEKVDENVEEEKLEMLPTSEQKLQTQLLTPNATQQIQLLSQESSLSLQPLSEDPDLPTPSLTQSVSVTNILPTTPKRRSFVERLKELRSLSSKSPRTRKSTVASPWFAPKRSSQIIPNTDSDSVDSEHSTEQVASDDEDHQKNKLSVTAVPQTIRQSPRLHKTLPNTPLPTAPQPTQQPGFRTTLSYFAPLSNLSAHFNTPVDVFATIVFSTSPTRAKTGPKDFYQSLYITDPSSASSQAPFTTARIFRPHKSAFPEVEQGDAILLRNFIAQNQAKQLMLLSTDSSAWAVFRKGEEVQIRGPPVEFAAEERGFVRGLWGWWASLSSDKRESLEAAVPKEKGKAKAKEMDGGRETATPSPRRTRAAARHELRDGPTYIDEPPDEDAPHNDSRRGTREPSTPTRRHTRRTLKHELRGGTTYTDPPDFEDQNENGTPSPRARDSNTSTPCRASRIVRHELRDGTTYTDGKLGGRYGVHELRDGTRYKDGGL